MKDDLMLDPPCPMCQTNPAWGVEVRGVYDGVLIWECPNCQYMWPRFSTGNRYKQAMEYITRWTTQRAEKS